MPNVHFLVRFFAEVLAPRSKQLSSGTPPSSILFTKIDASVRKNRLFCRKKSRERADTQEHVGENRIGIQRM